MVCATLAASAWSRADQIYVLRPDAVVAADVVRLGDIADIADVPGGERHTARARGAIALWRAPQPCRPVTATVDEVVARLRRLNALPPDLRIAGAAVVRIEVGCQRLGGAGVVGVAAEALGHWLQARSDRFDLAARDALGDVELPPGPVSLTARAIAPGQPPAARMQVWVDVAVADRFVRAVPLVFEVHAFRAVWSATHDLRAGQSLAGAALARREIDIATLPVEPVRAIPDNVRLRKGMQSGDALTASHMELRPQVAQGSTVVVTSRTGAFAVEARAEALQDGRVGQPVWVRVAASTGPVLAHVVDENMVELARD